MEDWRGGVDPTHARREPCVVGVACLVKGSAATRFVEAPVTLQAGLVSCGGDGDEVGDLAGGKRGVPKRHFLHLALVIGSIIVVLAELE